MRYFVTSEYGAKNGRPHYHMILFGFPFTGKMAGDLLAECWQNGFVQAHPLTIKEIAYVCKYMYEKVCVPRFFGMKRSTNLLCFVLGILVLALDL